MRKKIGGKFQSQKMCRDHVLQKYVALYFYGIDFKLGIMIRLNKNL